MQPNKISLVSLVAGAIMFFLPWVEVQCQGRTFVRQSGFQISTGSMSLADEFANGTPKRAEGKSAEKGVIVLASGVCLLLALWTAWLAVQDGAGECAKAGRLAAIALVLVVSQTVLGFPIERSLRDELKRSGNAGGAHSRDAMEAALAEQFKAAFHFKPQPALYIYIASLGVPVVIWLTSSRRRDGDNSDSTFTPQ